MGLMLGAEGVSAHSASGEQSSCEGTELKDVNKQPERSTPLTPPLLSLI